MPYVVYVVDMYKGRAYLGRAKDLFFLIQSDAEFWIGQNKEPGFQYSVTELQLHMY